MKPTYKINICTSATGSGCSVTPALVTDIETKTEKFEFKFLEQHRISYGSDVEDNNIYLEQYSNNTVPRAYPGTNIVMLGRNNELFHAIVAKRHINVPNFYMIGTESDFLKYIQPNKKYVLKGFYSAMGRDKFHFDSNNMEQLMIMLGYSEGESLNSNVLTPSHASLHGDDKLKEDCKTDHICPNGSYLMEDIGYEDIQEYRVVMFKTGAMVIEERKGYHPLSSFERKHTVCHTLPELISREHLEYIGMRFLNILEDMKYPYASFDLYAKVKEKDIDKRYGIFELCPQFGITYPIPFLQLMKREYSISLGRWCIEMLELADKTTITDPKQIRMLAPTCKMKKVIEE